MTRKKRTTKAIQIHLMLFFIWVYITPPTMIRFNSNTSHVILYPILVDIAVKACFIQIHLMLFFISLWWQSSTCMTPIQIHLMLFFIYIQLLYRGLHVVFKYISCYSLSIFDRGVTIWHTEFKYISCYSLSQP